MSTVNVQIDISSPTGRRLLRELEKHPKAAKVEYPIPEAIAGEKTYTLDDVYNKGIDRLSELYNVDMRKLKAKL